MSNRTTYVSITPSVLREFLKEFPEGSARDLTFIVAPSLMEDSSYQAGMSTTDLEKEMYEHLSSKGKRAFSSLRQVAFLERHGAAVPEEYLRSHITVISRLGKVFMNMLRWFPFMDTYAHLQDTPLEFWDDVACKCYLCYARNVYLSARVVKPKGISLLKEVNNG